MCTSDDTRTHVLVSSSQLPPAACRSICLLLVVDEGDFHRGAAVVLEVLDFDAAVDLQVFECLGHQVLVAAGDRLAHLVAGQTVAVGGGERGDDDVTRWLSTCWPHI